MMKKNKEFIEIKDVLLRVNIEEKRLKARLKEIQDFKMNALLILANSKMYNELRGKDENN